MESGLNLPPSLRATLLTILTILLLTGLAGNILTLLALPYVRKNYGSQFSVLNSSTAVLLLHLSLCDLCYLVLGFTHFIAVLLQDGDPYQVLGPPYSHQLCYVGALVRNWAAEADFATMGAIALCVCTHKLCPDCRVVGNPAMHDKHRDVVFGRRGIYVVIFFIWVVGFISISPDVFGVTGVYRWTNTMYGCDVSYTNQTHNNMATALTGRANIFLNLLVIIVCYAIVARVLVLDQKEAHRTMRSPDGNMFTKHIKVLFVLSIAYTICVVPASVLSWGLFDKILAEYFSQQQLVILQAVSSCVYWAMYGLNFVLYITTSERIRAAYRVFLKDMFRKKQRKTGQEYSDTRTWWEGLRQLWVSEET